MCNYSLQVYTLVVRARICTHMCAQGTHAFVHCRNYSLLAFSLVLCAIADFPSSCLVKYDSCPWSCKECTPACQGYTSFWIPCSCSCNAAISSIGLLFSTCSVVSGVVLLLSADLSCLCALRLTCQLFFMPQLFVFAELRTVCSFSLKRPGWAKLHIYFCPKNIFPQIYMISLDSSSCVSLLWLVQEVIDTAAATTATSPPCPSVTPAVGKFLGLSALVV